MSCKKTAMSLRAKRSNLPDCFVVSLLAMTLFAFSSTTAHAASKIVAIEIVNESRVPTEQIRNLLPFREGDLYDAAIASQAVSYFKKWNRFQEATLETRPAPGGLLLKIRLREGKMISGIDIYGGYPFLSARLRRILTVHSGDLYDPAAAQEQVEKLRSFYERRGYEETTVTLTPVFDDTQGIVDLVYRIRKGERYRIGRITVTGNTVFPYRYFVSQLNPLLAYEPGRFRKKIEKIRQDYREKGYLKARVRLKELGTDEKTGRVNPVLEIFEGKKVTVLFEGNRSVSRRAFKEILPMFTEGGYGDYEIESSVRAMQDYYRTLGFRECTIGPETRETGPNTLLVRFLIHEGPQTRVKRVAIEGNDAVSDRTIRKELLTKENRLGRRGAYRPETVTKDFETLPKIFHNHGALEAKAIGQETALNRFHDKATVTFQVAEGALTRISEVRFLGNAALTATRLKKTLKLREGDPVSVEKIEADRQGLLLAYANRGHPYAEVTPELNRAGNQAVLVYNIREGSAVTIGEILVVGNERTSAKAVERALLLKKGHPFSYSKVMESERSLRRAASFRSVTIETIGLTEKEPVVHLLVHLEEYRRFLIDFGVTYDTDNFFTGNATVTHLNLFGAAKNAVLKLTGGRDIQEVETILKDPHFLGYNFELALSGLIKRELRPSFKILEGGGSLSFLREFTPRLTFLGRYEATRTVFRDVIDPTDLTEEDHTTSKFSFSIHYDKRDSFADPHEGYVAFAGIDLSNKLFASSFNFVQPKMYVAHYLKLGSRVTLMNYLRMEGIKVFGGDTLTRDQRLFLGGDYTVRGFDEDSIGPVGTDGRPAGGQLLLTATTELQARLFNNFKAALFLDHGSISEDFSGFGVGSLRHAAGFGLRYVTPVGPIRLDYGIKLDKQAAESVGRFHFAFGYAF